MDGPGARTRVLDGLRIDEHPRPDGRDVTVAELRAELGESSEPAHLHGIGSLVVAAAREAARRPGVDVQGAVTLDRAALRFEGRPDAVAGALAAATAALADLPADRIAAARAELRDVTGRVTVGSLARWQRFGVGGHGLSALPLHGVGGAADDDVRRWAAHWHGDTVHVTAVGDVPDFDQHLPATGPVAAPVPVTAARSVPGTTTWTAPSVGLSWLTGSLPEDRAAAVIVAERLRARLVTPDGPGTRLDTEVELLQPGTQHVVVAIGAAEGREDELAAAAVAVVDELAGDGPTEVELLELVERQERGPVPVPVAADGLRPAAVAAAVGRARSELLVLLPGGPRAIGDLPVATVRDPARLQGRRVATLRAALWTRQRRATLELLEDGLRLDRPDLRLVVTPASAAALLRHRDGTRTVLLRDGRQLHLDPAAWRDGRRAADHVDDLLGSIAVDAPPATPPPQRLVDAARSPRWAIVALLAVLFVPFGVAATVLAVGAPMPGRLVLVPLAVGVTLSVVGLAVLFVRERFAARDALRRRELAGAA